MLTVQVRDVGPHRDLAVLQVMQQLRIEQRVALEEPVVGPGQAEAGHVAHRQTQQRAEEGPRQPERQVRAGLGKMVHRLAQYMLGDEVVAPSHADEGAVGVDGSVAGNVGTGIAQPHDQHPLTLEVLARDVAHRVAYLAVEVALEARQVRVPVAARGTDQCAVAAALTAAQGDGPEPAVFLFHTGYRRFKADGFAQPEGLRKAAHVLQDLPVRRIVRVMPGHGIAQEA